VYNMFTKKREKRHRKTRKTQVKEVNIESAIEDFEYALDIDVLSIMSKEEQNKKWKRAADLLRKNVEAYIFLKKP
jgi:hypothetical protein